MKKILFAAAGLTAALLTPALAATGQSAPPRAGGGDVAAGLRTFGQCRTCHAAAANLPNGIGPNLTGIYGRKAATRPGYAYSPALKAANLTWNEATLDRWLTDPAAMVHGTKMIFGKLPSKPVRDNVIAYLKTLK